MFSTTANSVILKVAHLNYYFSLSNLTYFYYFSNYWCHFYHFHLISIYLHWIHCYLSNSFSNITSRTFQNPLFVRGRISTASFCTADHFIILPFTVSVFVFTNFKTLS